MKRLTFKSHLIIVLRCELLACPGSVLDLCGIKEYFGCEIVDGLFWRCASCGESFYMAGLSGCVRFHDTGEFVGKVRSAGETASLSGLLFT